MFRGLRLDLVRLPLNMDACDRRGLGPGSLAGLSHRGRSLEATVTLLAQVCRAVAFELVDLQNLGVFLEYTRSLNVHLVINSLHGGANRVDVTSRRSHDDFGRRDEVATELHLLLTRRHGRLDVTPIGIRLRAVGPGGNGCMRPPQFVYRFQNICSRQSI